MFLYLRSIEPGHPDRLMTIRGKCWIASRSLWTRVCQAQGAWPGGPGPSQGPPGGPWDPVLDPFRPGSGPSRPPDPAIRDPDPGVPASPDGRESCDPSQFCQKGRLAPPDSQLFREMAGKYRFRACPGTHQLQIPTARAELKSALLALPGSAKSWVSGAFHSI